MRLYGKRFLKNSMTNVNSGRVETRDAILWDVLPDQRIARVKIQGSDRLITCFYPENWEVTPIWLKPGNAVRITHTGGLRSRIELSGHGSFIPTAVVGGTGTPPVDPGENGILSGLAVSPTPTPSMDVNAAAGLYRVNGTNVASGADSFTLSAAPSEIGEFRWDIIVGNGSGVLSVVEGTPATAPTPPTVPSVPSGSVLIRKILVPWGVTEIRSILIRDDYWAPTPSQMTATADFPDLLTQGEYSSQQPSWIEEGYSEYYYVDDEEPPGYHYYYIQEAAVVTFTVYDQYGNLLHPFETGLEIDNCWHFQVGIVHYSITGGFLPEGWQNISSFGTPSASLTYTREFDPENPELEMSPLLGAVLAGYENIQSFIVISIYNINGMVLFDIPGGQGPLS